MGGPDRAFDAVDRYFLALRVGSVAAAGLWAWRFTAPGTVPRAFALTAAFVIYSVALYGQVWHRPHTRSLAYLAVLPADLVVLFLVCAWSTEPLSGVYLAFYLLVALHAFYFGPPVGIGAAAGFAALYTSLWVTLPPAQRCPLDELLLRVGFAFLVAISLGLVSRQLRGHRYRLSEVNRQLQHRNTILEQTYRHLSVGRLAGELAHYINNPTAVIVGKVDVLRRRAKRDGLPDVYLQDLTTIADHAFRIARVARSFVALSPHREGPAQSLDLAKVAEGVALLFENQAARRGVHLEQRLAPHLQVHGQEAAVRQVLVNLLCNAIDAVESTGEVMIETRAGTEPGTNEVCVRDNGRGISREHLDEIFSPFFTTKSGAEGVGLGLSQSLTIVRRLGGSMSVDSTPGKGSTFTIALPAHARPAGREEAA